MNFKANQNTSKPEGGAGMVEFSLLIALISLVGMASLSALGQNVSQKFSNVAYAVACGGSVNNGECHNSGTEGD